jgi:outer membrane biogenesis lipoprotein LolB
MKLVLLTLATCLLAGCTQTNSVPPDARWSGPYHKGSGSGRGYPLWLQQNMTLADYEALAGKSDAAQ